MVRCGPGEAGERLVRRLMSKAAGPPISTVPQADLFLAAHKYDGVNVFDLSRLFATISIRDQATRAAILAARLPQWLRDNFPNEPRHRVLVVGGGVCGVSVAVPLNLHAGVPIEAYVLERSRDLFGVQRTCHTRWVDPAQYDWPAPHWRTGRFPQPVGLALPRTHGAAFPWRSDYSRRIVRGQWVPQLASYRAAMLGRILRSTTFSAAAPPFLNTPAGLVQVQLERVRRSGARQLLGAFQFHAVVLAVGAGRESCAFGDPPVFIGPSFWETDALQNPAYGAGGQVVISGSGDGALQDLIRVVTRLKSARDVWDGLGLKGVGIDLGRLLHLEADVERMRGWASTKEILKPYLDALQAEYERVVAAVLHAQPGLVGLAQTLAASAPATTHLVCSSGYFTCNYPLNRMVALLLIRALPKRISLHTGYKVDRLTPVAPVAMPLTASLCAAVPWTVELSHATQPMQTIKAAVVILRHGLTPSSKLPSPTLPSMPMTLY